MNLKSLAVLQSTGRPNVIVANLGYHGRTYGTMALTTVSFLFFHGLAPHRAAERESVYVRTTKYMYVLLSLCMQSGTVYRTGFGPLMGGVFVTPFPYVTRGPYAPDAGRQQAEGWATSVRDMSVHGAAPAELVARDVKRCLEALELMLRTQTAPSETVSTLW